MTNDIGQARSLEREGRLEEALKLCLKAIEKAPRDVEARALAVSLSHQLDQFVEWAHQLLGLADLHLQQSRPEIALELFDEFLQTPMEGRPAGECDLHTLLQREVYFQKGLIHRACQRLQQAERNFRESLTLAPDRWQTHLELGRTLMGMARYQEAAQVLQDGMCLSPAESGPILEALGDIFHHQGRDARKWYESAITHYKRLGQNEDVMRLSATLVDLFGDTYLRELT
jgi:tetratricopeptide (TPR) repeat protein